MKTGFVAVVGRPNAGKSTLVNMIVGKNVAIVTPKPQTTRNVIKGIYNAPGVQLVFMDTPGFHKPRTKLDSYMNGQAMGSTKGADLTIYMSDLTREYDEEESFLLDNLRKREGKVGLVLTKKDLSVPDKTKAKELFLQGQFPFAFTHAISSTDPQSIGDLVRILTELAPEGPAHYPTNQTTDNSDIFVIAELIREQALNQLRQEVPHALAVVIEKHEYDQEKRLYTLKAALVVERESQKPIVIGAGGSMIKKIGTLARKELEKIYDCQVFLELFVKVEPDWRNDLAKMKEMNYA